MEGDDLYDQLMKEVINIADVQDEHIMLHEVELMIDSVEGSFDESVITGVNQTLFMWIILLTMFGIGALWIYRNIKQSSNDRFFFTSDKAVSIDLVNKNSIEDNFAALVNEFRQISVKNDVEISNYKSKWEYIAPSITTTLVVINRELHVNVYYTLTDVETEILMEKMNEYKHSLIHIISIYELRKQLVNDEPYCNIESATNCEKLRRELREITSNSSLNTISELRDAIAYFSVCGLSGLTEFEIAENKLKELYSLDDENDEVSYHQQLSTDLNSMFQLYDRQIHALPSPRQQNIEPGSSLSDDIATIDTDLVTTITNAPTSNSLATTSSPNASAELHLRSTWLLESDRQRRTIELEIRRNKKRKDEIRENERESARRSAMQRKEKLRSMALIELEKQKTEAQGMQSTLDKKYTDLLVLHDSRKAALDGWDYFWAITIFISSILVFAIVSSKCILKHDPLQWFLGQLRQVCVCIQSCDNSSDTPLEIKSTPSQFINELYNYSMSKFMYNAITLMLKLGIDTSGWAVSSLAYCALYVMWRLLIPLSISYLFSLIGINMKIYGNLTSGNLLILCSTYFAFQNKLSRLYEYSHSLGSLLLCHVACYIALNATDKRLTWRYLWGKKVVDSRWVLCRVVYPSVLLCICVVIGCLNQADSSRGIKLSLKSNIVSILRDTAEECFFN